MGFVLEKFVSKCFIKKKKIQNAKVNFSLQILLNHIIMKMIFWAEIFPLISCYWCR